MKLDHLEGCRSLERTCLCDFECRSQWDDDFGKFPLILIVQCIVTCKDDGFKSFIILYLINYYFQKFKEGVHLFLLFFNMYD